MYNKLFTKILDSSIWLEEDTTRIVWFTLLAAMDEDGFAQFASVANLAHRARVDIDNTLSAVNRLENDDPNSSDPENGGKRIERVPGGWMVLNAEKYRKLVTRQIIREKTRERVAKHRKRKQECNALVTQRTICVTPSEAEVISRSNANSKSEEKSNKKKESTLSSSDSTSDAIEEVFKYWQAELGHPKAILSRDRRSSIKARLKEGYTVERIRAAILGCKGSAFNMGDNDRGKVFDDIELICRKGSHVDRFADMHENPPKGFKGMSRYLNAMLTEEPDHEDAAD
jgi:hypothetical protein